DGGNAEAELLGTLDRASLVPAGSDEENGLHGRCDATGRCCRSVARAAIPGGSRRYCRSCGRSRTRSSSPSTTAPTCLSSGRPRRSWPGLMHVPVPSAGTARYPEAPLYHLAPPRADRDARTAKALRYEPLRPGSRRAGLPLNVAYYLPEGRDVRVELVPLEDRGFVE